MSFTDIQRQRSSYTPGVQLFNPGVVAQQQVEASSRYTPPLRRGDPEVLQTNDIGSALADWRQNPSYGSGAQKQDDGGDSLLGRGLGFVINNPVSQAVLKPLEYLDYGRRAVTLGLEEFAEGITGEEMPSQLNPDGTLKDTRSNLDKLNDPTYGVGQLIRDVSFDDSLGNFFDKGVGFLGDVALDPLTWVTAGAGAAIGKAGKANAIAKLGKAQEAADVAVKQAKRSVGFADDLPEAQRALDRAVEYRKALGTSEDLEKYARRGIATATQPQMDAMGLGRKGLKLGTRKHNVHIPGSTPIAAGWHQGLGTLRSGAKKLPGARSVMNTRNYRGAAGQDMTEALNTLSGMPGASKRLGMVDAVNQFDADQKLRKFSSKFAAPLTAMLDKETVKWKEAGAAKWKEWRAEAAADPNSVNPFTQYAAEVREAAKSFGVELPELADVAYSMPHIMSRDFRDLLTEALGPNGSTEAEKAADAFLSANNMVTRDLLEDSGFRAKRSFTRGEEVRVGDKEFTIETGTIDELNEKFADMFPNFKGQIYEERPDVAWRNYIESMKIDVAKRATFQEMASESSRLVQRARQPGNFDPAGGPSPFPGEGMEVFSTRQQNPLPEGNEFYEPKRSAGLTKERNERIVANRPILDEISEALEQDITNLRTRVREDIRAVIAPARAYRTSTAQRIREIEGTATTVGEIASVEQRAKNLKQIEQTITGGITETQRAIKTLQRKRQRITNDAAAKGKKAAEAERSTYDETIAGLEDTLAEYQQDIATLDRYDDAVSRRLEKLLEDTGVNKAKDRVNDNPFPEVAPTAGTSELNTARADSPVPEPKKLQGELDEARILVRDARLARESLGRTEAAAADQMSRVSPGNYEYTVAGDTYKINHPQGKKTWQIEPPERLDFKGADASAHVDRTYATLADAKAHAEKHRVGIRGDVLLESTQSAESIRAAAKKQLPSSRKNVRIADEAAKGSRVIVDEYPARIAAEQKPDPGKVRIAPSRDAAVAAQRNLDEATRRAETLPARPTEAQVADSKTALNDATTDYRNKLSEAEVKVRKSGPFELDASDGLKTRRKPKPDDVRPSRVYPTQTEAGKAANRILANRPLYKQYLEIQNRLAIVSMNIRSADAGNLKLTAKQYDSLAEEAEGLRRTLAGKGGAKGYARLAEDVDTVMSWQSLQKKTKNENNVTAAKTRQVQAFIETPAVRDVGNGTALPGGMLTGEGTEMEAIRKLRQVSDDYREQIAARTAGSQEELTSAKRMRNLAPRNAERSSIADSNRRAAAVGKDEASTKVELADLREDKAVNSEAQLGNAEEYQNLKSELKTNQDENAIVNAVMDANPRAEGMMSDTGQRGKAIRSAVSDAENVLAYSRTLPEGPPKDSAEDLAARLTQDAGEAAEIEELSNVVQIQEQLIKDAQSGKLGSVIEYVLRKSYASTDEYGDLIIPAEFQKHLTDSLKVIKDGSGFVNLLKAYTNFFKTYATMTPGFHLRNALSAIFMNAVEGVSMKMQTRGMREWSKYARSENPSAYMRNLRNGTPEQKKIADALDAVFASGAGGRFFEAGIGSGGQGRTKLKEGLYSNWATSKSQRLGSWVEGPVRLGLAMDTIFTDGGNLQDALNRVTKIHFDYSQISDFDEKAKALIPFWTFMSRNLPTQLTMMYAKPKRYAQYNSFMRNFSEGNDPLTPSYWEDQGVFNTGASLFGSPLYVQPDLQHTRLNEDIEMIESLLGGDPSKLLSSANPGLTAPIEALTGYDFWRGTSTPADRQRDVGFLELPAAVLGTILGSERGTDWTAEGGPKVNERLALLFQSLVPDLDRAQRVAPQLGGDDYRNGAQAEGILRYLGLPVRQLTEQRRESEAKRQEVPFTPMN